MDGENTTILKREAKKSWVVALILKWQPVLVRGSLYFWIAFLSPLVSDVKAVGPRVILNSWTWLDWVIEILCCLLAGLVAIRIYMDNSFARHSDKLIADDKLTADNKLKAKY